MPKKRAGKLFKGFLGRKPKKPVPPSVNELERHIEFAEATARKKHWSNPGIMKLETEKNLNRIAIARALDRLGVEKTSEVRKIVHKCDALKHVDLLRLRKGEVMKMAQELQEKKGSAFTLWFLTGFSKAYEKERKLIRLLREEKKKESAKTLF